MSELSHDQVLEQQLKQNQKKAFAYDDKREEEGKNLIGKTVVALSDAGHNKITGEITEVLTPRADKMWVTQKNGIRILCLMEGMKLR